MYTYRIFKENLYCDSVGRYSAYGIRVNDRGSEVMVLHDVFLDYDDAERCAELFNSEQLDPIHLEQVVEDYLSGGI